MLRIISNYYKFNNEMDDVIKERIIIICKLYTKINTKDIDLYDIVLYFLKYYSNNNDFISFIDLKEKFSNFVFDGEVFNSYAEFVEYIKSINKLFKEKYKLNLINEYLSNCNDEGLKEKRLEVLDEIYKLEIDKEDVIEVLEIKDFNVSEILNKDKSGKGVMTGVSEVDEILEVGVLEGKIYTVVAPPGCFKTSFALNMSYNEIMNYEDSNVLFLTMEIQKEELYLKYLIRHCYNFKKDISYITLKTMKNGEGVLGDIKEVEDDFKKRRKSNLYLIDNNDIDIDNIIALKNMLYNIIDKYNIKSIYLDYIQLMIDMKPKGYNDFREWGNLVVGLFRQISVIKNCRIIMLSQANTEGIKIAEKTGGKFSLTNISELNTIKNHSYYIMTIFADDEMKISNQFRWQMLKFRDGETKIEPSVSYVLPKFYVLGSKESYIHFKKEYTDLNDGFNDGFLE